MTMEVSRLNWLDTWTTKLQTESHNLCGGQAHREQRMWSHIKRQLLSLLHSAARTAATAASADEEKEKSKLRRIPPEVERTRPRSADHRRARSLAPRNRGVALLVRGVEI